MSIMLSMVQLSNIICGGAMEEKVYKTMESAGVMSLVVGIAVTIVGVCAGVLMIISGARLITNKSKVLF